MPHSENGRGEGEVSRRIARLVRIVQRACPGLQRMVPQSWRSVVKRAAARGYEEEDRRDRVLARHAREELAASGRRESEAWSGVRDRSTWEVFRDERLEALRRSLVRDPPPSGPPPVQVVATHDLDGCRVENLVFESRPGVIVPANLYRPAESRPSMPGILVCHGHHAPKTQAELQDLGQTWARAGCCVLVPDQLGHGERRQHGFRTERDHDRPFRVGRQDYFFRYNLGIQLHLIGESLIGWMARDLVRGVDLLLARPGVDPERIVLVGAVAGGGDAAAVAAALDDRIGVVVPFGFGPARDLVGGGSWESTRNLRLSARDGFAPWVLLGSVAPRRLVYAHEFDWDAERDPVWPRLRSVFSWYDRPRHLASVHGRGGVRGPAPENTHCTNVGRVHRRLLDAHLERWLEIHAPSERNHEPLDDAALQCFTPLVPAELAPRPLHELVRELGAERLDAARGVRSGLDPRDRARRLRSELAELLGPIERGEPRVHILADPDRIDLEVTEDVRVRLRLSLPPGAGPWPVVIGLARQGMRRLCGARGELIDALVGGGAAVCLADVRGACDERGGDEQRGRLSLATRVSSDLLMLGRTSLGAALGDLRAVIAYLAQRPDLDAGRLVLWGDSLAPVNPRGCDLEVPYEAEPFPHLCEPLGGLLALVGGLFEERVDAVYLRGALVGYSDVLCGPFLYVPHDVVVPGLLGVADLCDVAAALAPRPLWLEGLVDGLNRTVDAQRLSDAYAPALRGYREAGTPGRLRLEGEPRPAAETAQWMLDALN